MPVIAPEFPDHSKWINTSFPLSLESLKGQPILLCFWTFSSVNSINIIDNRVSGGYYSFSNITALLIFVQLYIIYTNVFSDKFQNTGKIDKVTSSLIYLLGVLSSMSTAVLYIILKYYTTDGFTTLH